MSPFFENIYKSIETKGWVDIENEYYYLLKKYAIEESEKDNLHELNLQLQYLQSQKITKIGHLLTALRQANKIEEGEKKEWRLKKFSQN